MHLLNNNEVYIAHLHFVLDVLLLLIETLDQLHVSLLHFIFFLKLLICVWLQ